MIFLQWLKLNYRFFSLIHDVFSAMEGAEQIEKNILLWFLKLTITEIKELLYFLTWDPFDLEIWTDKYIYRVFHSIGKQWNFNKIGKNQFSNITKVPKA